MRFIPKKRLEEATLPGEVIREEPLEAPVQEEVSKEKEYDYEKVAEVIVKTLNATDEDYDYIFDTVEGVAVDPNNMDSDEVNLAISRLKEHYNLPEDIVAKIEQDISILKSPKEVRDEEQKDDLENDYNTLKSLVEDGRLFSSFTFDVLYDAMQKMQNKLDEYKSKEKQDNV